jgi:hypothetical protein
MGISEAGAAVQGSSCPVCLLAQYLEEIVERGFDFNQFAGLLEVFTFERENPLLGS